MNFAKQTEFATVASLYHRLALDFASHFYARTSALKMGMKRFFGIENAFDDEKRLKRQSRSRKKKTRCLYKFVYIFLRILSYIVLHAYSVLLLVVGHASVPVPGDSVLRYGVSVHFVRLAVFENNQLTWLHFHLFLLPDFHRVAFVRQHEGAVDGLNLQVLARPLPGNFRIGRALLSTCNTPPED